MKWSRQTGHSIVEALVVAVVVLTIGGIGLVVYQHNYGGAAPHLNTTNQPTNNQQQAIAQTLDIKEWGVHMTLDSTTSSMYYYISPSLPDVAYLSLKTVSDISPNGQVRMFL